VYRSRRCPLTTPSRRVKVLPARAGVLEREPALARPRRWRGGLSKTAAAQQTDVPAKTHRSRAGQHRRERTRRRTRAQPAAWTACGPQASSFVKKKKSGGQAGAGAGAPGAAADLLLPPAARAGSRPAGACAACRPGPAAAARLRGFPRPGRKDPSGRRVGWVGKRPPGRRPPVATTFGRRPGLRGPGRRHAGWQQKKPGNPAFPYEALT